jgi:hypothetical protein
MLPWCTVQLLMSTFGLPVNHQVVGVSQIPCWDKMDTKHTHRRKRAIKDLFDHLHDAGCACVVSSSGVRVCRTISPSSTPFATTRASERL